MPTISLKQTSETVVLAVSGLLVALAISWLLLASVNFSYSIWLDHAGISEAIERYGPQNRFKAGFHKTDREQRIELFEGITHAIHFSGEGLAELSFKVEGEPIQTLLTESEVIHLQDVANLIDVGKVVALVAAFIWFGVWGYLIYFKRPVPSLLKQMLVILGLLGVTTIVVVSIGAVDVFYALHEVVFPEGHQWYYFYQDSLMATLMYAPYLFGWIAIELLVLTVPVCLLLQYGGVYLSLKLSAGAKH
jgi:hypothetical protein